MTDGPAVLHRHVTEDGSLVWRVERHREGAGATIIMDFDGLPWHMHPEVVERRGRSDEKIADDVTAALLADKLVILTVRSGSIVEHKPLFDLETELATKPNEELWTLRFWSGRTVTVEDLIDGRVDYLPLTSA
jgi:hypothetical protein